MRPRPAHGPARCRLCGRPLDGASASDICDALACQTRLRMEQSRQVGADYSERRYKDWELARRRTAPVMAELARRLGVEDVEAIPTTVTPHVTPPLVERDLDEVMAFARHLAEIVEYVFSGKPIPLRELEDAVASMSREEDAARLYWLDPAEDDREAAAEARLQAAFALRDQQAADDPMELVAACIACGGNCCTTGLRNHAYLQPLDIAYYRHHTPDATPASIMADYLSRIPARSLSLACLFQTETGCVLPRQIRARPCNAWQCGARRDLAEEIREKNAGCSAIVGLAQDHMHAPEEGAPKMRAVTVKDGVVTLHDDLRLPALEE